jgi:ribonuclease-3
MDLDEVQERLGVEFKDTAFLLEALTHSSCLNEPQMGLRKDNESLAWVGDALVYWILSENEYREGLSTEELHNRREKHINKGYLAGRAVYYGLDFTMIMTKGEEKKGGRTNQTNLHTVFEAIVGAIYKDMNYENAKNFILKSCI